MVKEIPKGVLFVAIVAAILNGCSQAPQSAKPVSWYLEHADERQAKIGWCADDAARKDTPDCRNALEASQRKAMGKMSDAPPLDWNQPDKKPK